MADTPGTRATEADREAGARPDTPRAPVLVSTAEAARIAGVNPRTVRRWIERGYLTPVDGPDGSGISPADLPAARDAAARAGGGGRPPDIVTGTLGRPSGQGAGVRFGRAGTPGGQVSASVVSARQQLEAIREEWLAPLVDRIGTLEREAGRLEERALAAERDRDALAARIADDRKLADQLVDVLQAEREAAVQERDRVADRLAEVAGRDAAALREAEERARVLQEQRDRLASQVETLNTAWRSASSVATPRYKEPWWRFWERWR